MIDELKGKRVPVKLWARVSEVESVALDQLRNIAALPWVMHHVAVMPDVHYGKGATVGSVVAMKDAISPAAVGVDIGCGMAAVRTNLVARKVEKKVEKLRSAIEEAIPVGTGGYEEAAWEYASDGLRTEAAALMADYTYLSEWVQDIDTRASRQLGTLGGGNHFIEVCFDTDENVWLMLHSGSRNVGKTLAEVHMARARKLAHNQELPDRDLAVFLAGTPEMAAYRRDLFWAQEYARINRAVMVERCLAVLEELWPGLEVQQTVMCHHNYVAEETHFGDELLVTRKGAIRAGLGEMGIIPGSMGTRSYIVRGRGNPESFHSASHGAGRRMSRGKAKERFTLDDLRAQTKGVECKKDFSVIDEIPGAYKDIEKVMANQADLVEIVAELKQVMCVKG